MSPLALREFCVFQDARKNGTGNRSQAVLGAQMDLIIKNLECIPDFVKQEDASMESGIPPSIPALEQGGRILALVGNSEAFNK